MKLPYLPYEVELIIWRFLHEMKMSDVLQELKEECDVLEKVMSYLNRRNTFCPLELIKRIMKSNRSIFYKNKIQRHVQHKVYMRCIKRIKHMNYLFPSIYDLDI